MEQHHLCAPCTLYFYQSDSDLPGSSETFPAYSSPQGFSGVTRGRYCCSSGEIPAPIAWQAWGDQQPDIGPWVNQPLPVDGYGNEEYTVSSYKDAAPVGCDPGVLCLSRLSDENFCSNTALSNQLAGRQLECTEDYNLFHVSLSSGSIVANNRTASSSTYAVQCQSFAPEVVQEMSARNAALHEDSDRDHSDDSTKDEDDDKDEDENDDWDSDSTSSDETSGCKSKPSARTFSMQVGRRDFAVDSIQQQAPRPHMCTVFQCDASFTRPEHLKRHANSKHMGDKKYVCKVTGCEKPFSRNDNLREHYFTHLEHGGRRGRNIKMTLQELKRILGPDRKGRDLVRRLGRKYKRYQEKR